MRLRPILILVSLLFVAGFLAYRIELALPATSSVYNTFTPLTQPAPQEIGSYDVLGKAVDKEKAAKLLQTEAGRQQLSPENGAVAITEDLLNLEWGLVQI